MNSIENTRHKYAQARLKRNRDRKVASWTIAALVIGCAIYAAFFTFEDRARRNAIECADAHGLVPQDAYPSNTDIVWGACRRVTRRRAGRSRTAPARRSTRSTRRRTWRPARRT